MKTTKLDAIKTGVELVVSVGVGAVVGHVLKSNVPTDLKLFQKISVGVGTFAVSNVLGDLAAKYTTGMINDTVDQIRAAETVIKNIPND